MPGRPYADLTRSSGDAAQARGSGLDDPAPTGQLGQEKRNRAQPRSSFPPLTNWRFPADISIYDASIVYQCDPIQHHGAITKPVPSPATPGPSLAGRGLPVGQPPPPVPRDAVEGGGSAARQ